jgi:hypothetical protein
VNLLDRNLNVKYGQAMNTFGAIWLLFWILVATLPIFTILVTIALFHWRKHPRFEGVFNFNRPLWVAFFISLGIVAFGFIGGYGIAPVLGFNDEWGLMGLACAILIFAGAFSCFVSSVRFSWCLIAAIIHHD